MHSSALRARCIVNEIDASAPTSALYPQLLLLPLTNQLNPPTIYQRPWNSPLNLQTMISAVPQDAFLGSLGYPYEQEPETALTCTMINPSLPIENQTPQQEKGYRCWSRRSLR